MISKQRDAIPTSVYPGQVIPREKLPKQGMMSNRRCVSCHWTIIAYKNQCVIAHYKNSFLISVPFFHATILAVAHSLETELQRLTAQVDRYRTRIAVLEARRKKRQRARHKRLTTLLGEALLRLLGDADGGVSLAQLRNIAQRGLITESTNARTQAKFVRDRQFVMDELSRRYDTLPEASAISG